jgi:hypothetical protein
MVVHPGVLIGFQRTEDLERALHRGGFAFLEIPKEVLSLAGKPFALSKTQGYQGLAAA